jgi:alkylation response protein AidB-like acyl-CoA dehydrogenase
MSLNPLVDSRDVRFVLFELIDGEQLTKYPKYEEFDKETFEDVISLAESIAVEQVYPINGPGDEEGAKYDPKTQTVTLPAGYKTALDAYHEAGFGSLYQDPELDGMGLPVLIHWVCTEYFTAASMAFSMYPALSIGAANLVKNFGTEEQKKTYLDKMFTGEWGGTMCLTEPDAGSDVGALRTKAVKQDDGSYLITGQKIFISSGDGDYYDNIVHPVLARIEGDPTGTKGISIFIVPKINVNEDGSLGEPNDVTCTGIEHKMGIKASSTAQLSFGDNEKCIGYLLGEPKQGMKIMFQMMNEARLYVALQGLSTSSSAYNHAVTYARNRRQMPHVSEMRNPEAKSVPIIQHPDIQRTLLWMKSHVEAMRALCYYTGLQGDLAHVADGEEAREAQALVEFLTPIAKAGNTDNAWLVTSEAIQVYGGYGFCSDYPVEQLARDTKIQSLYEGTNGIQSMDLIMRKLLMNKEQYNYSIFKKRIAAAIEKARGVVGDKYVSIIEAGLAKTDALVEHLKADMGAGKFLKLFADATPLLKALTMMTYAWLHLEALTIATPKMKALVGDKKGARRAAFLEENNEAAFYTGKVLSGQFYIGAEFQKYPGMVDYIMAGENAVVKASDAIFTGALEE